MSKPIHDPATYRRLSEPFASPAEAEKAVVAFFDGVRELREKHHIRDALIVAFIAVTEDGRETERLLTLHCGNAENVTVMAASVLRQENERRQAMLAEAVAPTPRAGKKAKP